MYSQHALSSCHDNHQKLFVLLSLTRINTFFPFQSAVIVCFLMMFTFLTLVTETDGKPANEYEFVAGAKPVYKKKL